jgi:single-stranded DNA-binding protein
MSAGDTILTITGNLTADPDLRFTGISREFAISEVLVGLNRRVDRRG